MQGIIKRSVCSLFCVCCILMLLPVMQAKANAQTVSTKEELAAALYERAAVIAVQAESVDTMLSEVLCAYPLLGYTFEGYKGSIRGDTITITMDYRDDELLPVLYVDSDEDFVETVTQAAVVSTEEIHIVMPPSMWSTDFGSLINRVFSESVLARTMFSAFSWETWTNSYTDACYMSLTMEYNVEHSQLVRYKRLAEAEAIRLAGSLFYEGAEDAVIALLAHDAIVNRCTYSQEGNFEELHSVYGVLCNRVAVCEGYAEAYQLLMDIAGVDCRYVAGKAGEPHAWNLVQIDGAYYHVDTTWDDPVGSDGVQRLLHSYFLLSDAELAKTHTWERSMYPVANATLWDAAKAKAQLAQSNTSRWASVEYTPQCDDAALQAYAQQMADLLQQQKPPSATAQTTTESETTQSTTIGTEQATSSADTEQQTTPSQSQSISSTEETTSAATTTTTAAQHQGVSKGALYLVWGILIVFVLGILYAKFIH